MKLTSHFGLLCLLVTILFEDFIIFTQEKKSLLVFTMIIIFYNEHDILLAFILPKLKREKNLARIFFFITFLHIGYFY